MLLELTVTSYQRLSPSVTGQKTVEPNDVVVIGRATDCDWHLPDPLKVLSSRHAEIRFSDGHYTVTDISTNGVFLNGEASAIGRGSTVAIKSGDCLRLGDFEVVASVVATSTGQVESDFSKPLENKPLESQPEQLPPIQAESSELPLNSNRVAGDSPATAGAFGDFLAAGLGERVMADSHVPMQEPAIPGEWHWGRGSSEQSQGAATAQGLPVSSPAPRDHATATPSQQSDALTALAEGLGLPSEKLEGAGPAVYKDLGSLTRVLLDRLLDMIHMRARQKQQLRVAQTLFQRSENNPLKFSATPQDALDSLLIRPHAANLGPVDAVNKAFDDLFSHEQALLKGVESVVQDLLADTPNVTGTKNTTGLFARRKALETITRHRAWQRDVYGSTDSMLRSDVFVEAYEQAVGQNEESAKT
ncbi:type VI secretion system-associated FHA domain protein TagH [Marinobacter salexigens]|uniref:Type VI secretion system-associated FHA domain protein TagH n=1 Tax=Marinobacter salexigens TaxID=1925763 RepID=A0ABS6A5B7_9GAMM|nr:type VI secretion system-associated FHA domain protein TagH [Marinobacter salexigens]MBU2873107.1 type VI secretion system-associated FHA domain protein TagH [Marinobacter salexigens]